MRYFFRKNASRIRDTLNGYLILPRVILTVPLAYAIHVLEESFGFQPWVATHFSVAFTTYQFRRNNLIFLAVSMLLSWMAYRSFRRSVLFIFISWLSGLFIHNALFHLGATLYFQDFSPGLISSSIIYLPLSFLILKLMLREGLIDKLGICMAFIVGAFAHYAFIAADLSGWLKF